MQEFSRRLRGLRGSLKDKIQTIFNIEKSWKMSKNAEEPSQKRQRFANLESEDLYKAQSIIQHTLYLFHCSYLRCWVNLYIRTYIKIELKFE